MQSNAPQGYYAASLAEPPRRPPLAGRVQTDVCVIGGGYTGLSAALHAASSGARVELLESQTIGFGASGRNGGQIHTGLRKDQSELERWLGREHARDLWNLSEEAKELIGSLVRSRGIACDLKSGLVIAAHDRAAAKALERDAEHLALQHGYDRLQIMGAEQTAAQLGTHVYPASRFDSGGGHLHPLAFARGLATAAEASGAIIREGSLARAIDEEPDAVRVRTDGGEVHSKHAIVACDAYTGELVPKLDRFIGHIESFVTATAPLSAPLASTIIPCDAAIADTRHVLDYYRKSADHRLLFAGRETYFGMPRDIAAVVRPRMLNVFPQLADIRTEYAWSGTVGITVTRMPHFGALSDRVFFAHGYSGQGVALATLAGKLLAEAALGRREKFDVFARVPARAFPGGHALRKPLMAAGLLAFKLLDAL